MTESTLHSYSDIQMQAQALQLVNATQTNGTQRGSPWSPAIRDNVRVFFFIFFLLKV